MREQLFDLMPDGLLVLDKEGRVADANPALLRIARFDGPVPVGAPVETLFAGEPGLLKCIQEAGVGEQMACDCGGERIYAVLKPMLDSTVLQGVPGQLIVVHDVTEDQKNAQRLRASEDSMRRLFEASPFPTLIVGTAEKEIYAVNPACMQFFNLGQEELLGHRATEFILSDLDGSRDAANNTFGEVLQGKDGPRKVLLAVTPIVYMSEQRLRISFVDVSERLRLEQAEHERRVLSEALVETSAMIHSTLDLDEVLDHILANLHRVVQYEVANIMLINEQGLAYIARTRGYGESAIPNPFGNVWLKVDDTQNMRWMVENRKPVVLRDVTQEPGWVVVLGQEAIRGHASAPIITTQGAAGFINVDSSQENFFSAEDGERLMIFANHAGAAIDNARLYAAVRKAAEEADTLQQISLAAGSSLDFNTVIERIFELINHLVPSDSAGVQLIDGDELVLKAFRGFHNDAEIIGTRWKLAGTANEQVLQARKPVIFSDVQASFNGYRVPPHNHIRSLLMIPLVAGGEVIGFLSLDSFVLAHFTEEDLRLANLLAGAISTALENAHLYDIARRRNQELEILNRAGLAVASDLDLDRILVDLYEQCRQAVPADSFYVALYHEETGEIEFPLFQDADVYRSVPPLNIAIRKGMAGQVIEGGQTIYIPDLSAPGIAEKYQLIHFGGNPSRTYLGVPLVLREKVIGVISMQSLRTNAYSQDQVRLVETISTHAAIAIEKARLYKQAQMLATTDDLTGLLNRRELFRRANLELERAIRYRHNLSAMMLDFDHFKRVNDTYGHLTGDEVLRVMARVCQENMRLVDVVGRFGGEEILILAPETSGEQALEAAERLRKAIAACVVEVDGKMIRVTASIGVAGFKPAAGMSLTDVINGADQALFQAKRKGRNQVCLAQES